MTVLRRAPSTVQHVLMRRFGFKAPRVLGVVLTALSVSVAGCEGTKATDEEAPVDTAAKADAPPAIVSKPEWGKERMKLEFLQRQVQKDGCNKRHALDLAEKLNAVSEYDMAIAVVDKYWAACDAWPRILWPKSVALRNLKRFSEGAPVVTKLIEADLVDSDYWWWRGRHYAEAKDFDRAEADFRQSNANKPSGWGSGKMSGYLGDARPCESAFLVSRYTEQSERKIGDWALPAKTKHWVAGGCDALAGKGSTTIRWKSTAPVVKTKVKVEKVSADAIVDVKAGYTVVSKAFATANSITAGPEVQALAVGQLVTGNVGTAAISVGGASAPAVKVLIVDAVPGNVDVILGQSFFVRFKNVVKPTSLKLSAR